MVEREIGTLEEPGDKEWCRQLSRVEQKACKDVAAERSCSRQSRRLAGRKA